MTRYVFREGRFVEKKSGEPMLPETHHFRIARPYVMSDTPAYRSPVTRQMIEGRAARREDLKRTGSREVDPSEFKPQYRDKANSVRNGGEWNPDAGKERRYSGFLKD